jgi:hypothetical protein
MIRPRKVCVVIGAPIHVDLAAAGDGASPRRVPRAAVKAATEELAVELQRLFDLARDRVG